MIYRNGYHPGGSTKTNDPKSTHASDDSAPNIKNSLGDDGDHPTPHESVDVLRGPLGPIAAAESSVADH